MARRKYTCPHCNQSIKVVSNKGERSYAYCPDCNMRYVLLKATGAYIAEYTPRIVTKLKGAE